MSPKPSPSPAMLLLAVGGPSSLTYAFFALLRSIVHAAFGSHELIQAVHVEDVRRAWQELDRSDPKPIMLMSDCPSSSLGKLVTSTRLPYLLVAAEFEQTAWDVTVMRAMPLPETLRFVTQAYCSARGLYGERALVVGPDQWRRPIGDVILSLAQHFGFESPEALVVRWLAVDSGPENDRETLETYAARQGLRTPVPSAPVDPEARAVVEFMATQYGAVALGRDPERIDWPSEMFLDWDRPGQLLRGPIDMLGPARFLICGPYFHLPADDWTAEIAIELAENASGNRLSVDLFSGEVLGGVVMRLPELGVFGFSFSFRTTDPFLPVELRFQILEGAIEGRLALRSVSFVRAQNGVGRIENATLQE